MQFANRIKIDRKADHFIIRFGASQSSDESDEGAEVAVIALPLTTGTNLSLDLFSGMFSSIPELHVFMDKVQLRINDLNKLGAQSKPKDAIQ